MLLVVRAGKDSTSTVIELWESSRIIAELQIPTKLHGSIFADGWFSTGAAWDPSESKIAYVAEVSVAQQQLVARLMPLLFNYTLQGVHISC